MVNLPDISYKTSVDADNAAISMTSLLRQMIPAIPCHTSHGGNCKQQDGVTLLSVFIDAYCYELWYFENGNHCRNISCQE